MMGGTLPVNLLPRLTSLAVFLGLLMPAALASEGGALAQTADEQEDEEDLAKRLANPVASLISVPIQMNYDHGIGPSDDGEKLTTNIQPVIPFSLNDNWNVVSRTITPIVWQDDIFPGAGSQFGLGDVTQSLFFSPARPTSGGLIWGVGPVLVLPTATN